MISAAEKGELIRNYEEAVAAMNLNNFATLSWPWAPTNYERARRVAAAVREARARLEAAGLLPSV